MTLRPTDYALLSQLSYHDPQIASRKRPQGQVLFCHFHARAIRLTVA